MITDDCRVAHALSGEWKLTTRVTTAKRRDGMGVTGYYDVRFVASACKLHAEVTKTGYASKVFEAREIQRASPAVTIDVEESEAEPPGGARRARVDMMLHLASGITTLDVRMMMSVEGDHLYGEWKYEGESWSIARMAGVLVARRGPNSYPELAHESDVSCDRRCDSAGLFSESNSRFSCIDDCQSGRAFGHE